MISDFQKADIYYPAAPVSPPRAAASSLPPRHTASAPHLPIRLRAPCLARYVQVVPFPQTSALRGRVLLPYSHLSPRADPILKLVYSGPFLFPVRFSRPADGPRLSNDGIVDMP